MNFSRTTVYSTIDGENFRILTYVHYYNAVDEKQNSPIFTPATSLG